MHVVVGVLFDQYKQLLIAKRPNDKTKAGFWEFPGGKIEPGETALEALKREFQEEVAINIDSAQPLIKFTYHNGEREVILDTWRITAYNGVAAGVEGQLIKWIGLPELDNYTFLAGNKKIIELLKKNT